VASFVENLLRSRDLLDAQLEFFNLTLDTADPADHCFAGQGPASPRSLPSRTNLAARLSVIVRVTRFVYLSPRPRRSIRFAR
jgi:hypothetical protein